MSVAELEFAVFCIEEVAIKLQLPEVYQELREGIADLHCRSDQYVVDELKLECQAKSCNG